MISYFHVWTISPDRCFVDTSMQLCTADFRTLFHTTFVSSRILLSCSDHRVVFTAKRATFPSEKLFNNVNHCPLFTFHQLVYLFFLIFNVVHTYNCTVCICTYSTYTCTVLYIIEEVNFQEKTRKNTEIKDVRVVGGQCSVTCVQEMANKRKHLSLAEKVKILEFNETANLSARKLADQFSTGRAQATDIINGQEEILKQWASNGSDARKHLKVRVSEASKINDIVYEWFCTARAKNVPVSCPLLQGKAIEVAEKLKVSDFKASNGWLEKLLKTLQIKFERQAVLRRAAAQQTKIIDYFK